MIAFYVIINIIFLTIRIQSGRVSTANSSNVKKWKLEIRGDVFIPLHCLNNCPPIGLSFSKPLVCAEIPFGRRLFCGQDALRGK